MIDWVSIVRHSSRRFSVLNFAGGGRQRRGGNFHAPKTHHHKSMPSSNATDSLSQSDEKISSTCCFSNVRIYWIFLLIDMFELNCLRCSQAFFCYYYFFLLLSEIYTFLMLIWWYFLPLIPNSFSSSSSCHPIDFRLSGRYFLGKMIVKKYQITSMRMRRWWVNNM